MDDVMDLIEARQKEYLEELGKLNPTDPKSSEVVKNFVALSGVADDYEQRDQKRLEGNAKNDIEEQKLIIEMQRINNDKIRARLDFAGRLMFFVGSMGMGFFAYDQEKLRIAAKPFVKVKDDLMRFVCR